MQTEPLIDQHAIAARQTIDLARHVAPDQLTLPTPCSDWNLRELLHHMTTENVGFAAAARGDGADLSVWLGDPDRADPVGDYVDATEKLIAAFAGPGVLQQSFALPLLTQEREFPGEQAVLMQLIDSVVHAWDLARTLDRPLDVADDITATILPLCERIASDESRRTKPGATFGPPVPHTTDATALEHIVALLGRPPTWPN